MRIFLLYLVTCTIFTDKSNTRALQIDPWSSGCGWCHTQSLRQSSGDTILRGDILVLVLDYMQPREGVPPLVGLDEEAEQACVGHSQTSTSCACSWCSQGSSGFPGFFCTSYLRMTGVCMWSHHGNTFHDTWSCPIGYLTRKYCYLLLRKIPFAGECGDNHWARTC